MRWQARVAGPALGGLLLAMLGISAAPPAAARGVTVTMTVDGIKRTALVFPGKDAANTPSPLVFYFHSLHGDTSQGSDFIRFQAAWPEATVAYPQALPGPLHGWQDDGSPWQTAPGDLNDRDLHFVDALYRELAASYKVDERRVYAAGFSAGAWFTYVVLTARPELFAAFAPVDGCLEPFAKWASVPRPVLVITDRGGCGQRPTYELRQLDWLRRLNGCGTEMKEWAPRYISFGPSTSGQPVIWRRDPGPHDWPSYATKDVVRFFKEHALADKPQEVTQIPLSPEGAVAGSGTAGIAGDGGPATMAQLHFPEGIAIDGAGSLFVADTYNSRVRRVTLEGMLQTVVGSGVWEYPGLGRSNDRNNARTVQLFFPQGVAVDRQGNLFIADSYNARVRKVSPDGMTVTVAGSGLDGDAGDGGPVIQARIYFPTAVAVDAAGNLFIADTGNHRIRKVDASGAITTLAGTGVAGFAGEGGAATSAQLHEPRGLALDDKGNLYIADSYNHRVRKVSLAGVITTVAGTGPGTREASGGFSGDGGPATAAQLNFPEGVAVDSAGNLFVADSGNHRVRKVEPGGIITTVAGGESGTVVAVPLRYPEGLAVDRAGNLYVADPLDHRVRQVTGVAAPGLLAGQPFPNP
jgi:sugar lactone lactonase YvrE